MLSGRSPSTPLLGVCSLLFALPLAAGDPVPFGAPPVTADVVVSAEASPAPPDSLGVAATVIGPEAIARSRATTLLELLRSVPGLDVAQSGGPGGVTSLFLRGTNSNQFLLLVDGVKVNSPYFGGADLSAVSTANVDRVEVVRGPFSALYGSEAVGGVVQVFTKRAAADGRTNRVEGEATLGAGNLSAREGSAAVTASTGPVGLTAGYRRTSIDGDLPNSAFDATNASAALDLLVAPGLRAGVVVRHDVSSSGIPFNGPDATPRRQTTTSSTTWAVPVSWALSDATTLEAAFRYAADRPGLTDPDDPWGYTFSSTDARRAGGRLAVTTAAGAHRISAGADWERTVVSNEDSYGVELDGLATRTWSLFVEDRLTLADGTVGVTAGVRFDDHSVFGTATSPRLTVSWRLSPSLRLRAAAGSAFRAPTTGELYYPFSGNPDLQPERSVSVEGGLSWSLSPEVAFEATLFHSSVRDLIRYDFATFKNVNVGRARMTGAETALTWTFRPGLFARAAWTWLDTEDLDTGLELLRRPRNRASATLGAAFGDGGSAELTGLFVGRRDDVDAVTYGRVTDPSYLRVDLAVTAPRILGHLSPFLRVTNLLDRQYTEVAGYPSPGRRFLAGLNVGF